MCAQISPWNYPLLQASWKLAPALVAGCTVVIKPSELTPLTTLRLTELAHEVGFPTGVINTVLGPGPTVGAELIKAAALAVTLALAAILVYIWFRFEWQFGLGAVVALTHDVISTVGIFSLLGLEFNLSTVAAVLTIAGYSINDTVVVYDRVRENLRKFKTLSLPQLLNDSINQTLSRTVMTSLTTLLALLALFFLGGTVIRDFSFAMIWGVVIGTYSSICLAVPLLLYLNIARRGGLVGGDNEEAAAAESAP